MSFSQAIVSVFSHYATFSGRARRSEYWYFTLFNILINIVLSIVGAALPILTWLGFLYAIAAIVPALAVCCRRLHDTGRSGAFMLLAFIPVIGGLILLIWVCQDSQPGVNQYGPSPKDQVW
ncbi:MAG: DUF805 domain-containing protein [Clostridiales bacterium]|nr:DUF805 domain-containing protein [Clostridiales bacterium]